MPSARAIRCNLHSLALAPISASIPIAAFGAAALRAGARPLGLRQRAVRSGPGTVSSLRCGPHHFPALRSGALAVCAPVLGREAADAAWGVCKAPTDVMSHCVTRAPSANPKGPPLRSGAGRFR